MSLSIDGPSLFVPALSQSSSSSSSFSSSVFATEQTHSIPCLVRLTLLRAEPLSSSNDHRPRTRTNGRRLSPRTRVPCLEHRLFERCLSQSTAPPCSCPRFPNRPSSFSSSFATEQKHRAPCLSRLTFFRAGRFYRATIKDRERLSERLRGRSDRHGDRSNITEQNPSQASTFDLSPHTSITIAERLEADRPRFAGVCG
jgi:hypothetical protein